MNDKELVRFAGLALARKLLAIGTEGDEKCWRIQFMVGDRRNERPVGGMAEEALAQFFARELGPLISEEVPE